MEESEIRGRAELSVQDTIYRGAGDTSSHRGLIHVVYIVDR